MEETEKQTEIVSAYKEILEQRQQFPTYADFLGTYKITKETIRHHFGGIQKLREYMQENHKEIFEEHIFSVNQMFDLEKSIVNEDKKIFVVTTAVADSKAHTKFLATLESYCSIRDAQLVIMPCESTTNSFENETASFAREFNNPNYLFVNRDIQLNDNISLCSIQVTAKQIKPITGLSRLGNREGSYVFASPKQFLEYVPAGNKRGSNYSIMTTGACTLPEYFSNRFVSKRLSYIAEQDHTFGAVIIEIEDEKTFHFRQIQTDLEGSFVDLGIEYHPDGSTNKVPVNVVFGDLHGVQVDWNALNGFIKAFQEMDIDKIFLHDVFDGFSISHHVTDIASKTTRHWNRMSNLKTELNETFDLIWNIDDSLKPSNIYVVKSNHDEFLSRYLSEGRYVSDPENHYLALKIAPALFEEQDVLQRGFIEADDLIKDTPDHWIFLTRNDSEKIGGIECASHGDLGSNGAKPSLDGLERAYGSCVIGHNHSAAIQRGVFRVGTLSKLDMGYNRGPTSWTQTCCLVYENGQRQLINFVNGSCGVL